MTNKLNAASTLGQLAGAASLCWRPKPTGVFDPEKANKFVAEALTQLEQEMLRIVDTEWNGTTWAQEPYWKGQKDLKAELRTQIKAFFNSEEKL